MKKAAIFWSGGKDSAFALHLARKDYDIHYLITTFSASTKRATMHGVSESLIEKQADEIGIPLMKMWLDDPSNLGYEISLNNVFRLLEEEGIDTVIFGDILLEDLRIYRDRLIAQFNLNSVYPLWKKDTSELIKEIKSSGFQTMICSADADHISEEYLGNDLWNVPAGTHDPCGENGEFHTFCYDGPIFRKKIEIQKGEIIEQTYELNGSKKMFRFIELM